MAGISREFVRDMLDRLDIEDVISSYISLKRNGRTLKGLCPFHNEKTPSFTVYPDTRSFYCFGCGASGDVISFIMRMDNLDYVEAVKTCAERAGMTMPEDGYDDTLAKLRVRILNANREAARFYNSTLWSEDGKAGLEYFQKRHLPKNIINHFGLGYAPDSWQKLSDHLKALGFTEQELIHANLAKRSGKTGRIYDAFRNRVMFPVMDLRGNVIAFSGRVLDDSKPKYINTEDTPVYKKGNGVYALNFAKNTSSRQLILAEGQMDVIALHEFGFTNAIATLGTALTKEQANLIARYADELLICYDNDDAGKKATEKALNIFGQTGIKLKIINMSGGKDADEILRTYGRERFAAMLSASENDVEYRLDREKANYNILTDDGKVRFLSAAAAILASCTEVEKEIYSNRLSSEFGISKTSFDTQIKNESR
ncbi:MAG: DNA primase, partial [Clostridia bacterium]|nr:DNA primase [Clostridia bacterium]